jgi:secreted trypsin-like serine protease
MEVRESSFHTCFVLFFLNFLYSGDSGSPIFERYSNQWVQVGLASNCRMSSGLGVFTKLATYSRWIQSVLNPNITESVHVYGCDKKAPCGCGQTDVTLTSSRILDGEYAITHSWPMMVSIQRYNKHQCGGTILSDSFVLTAAECLSSYEDSNITITAGIHRLSETVIVKRNIDRIYFHPNYTRVRPYLHDIAIVHLAQPLPLGNISWTFAKTCVPITNEAPSGQYPVPNSQLVVIGWGNSRLIGETSDVLRQIPVRVINNDHRSCSSSLVNSTYQFCAESSNIAESTNNGYLCYGRKN